VVPVPPAIVEPALDDLVPPAVAGPAPESHDTAVNARAAKTTNPITHTTNGASRNLDRLVFLLSFRPSSGALPIDSRTWWGLGSSRLQRQFHHQSLRFDRTLSAPGSRRLPAIGRVVSGDRSDRRSATGRRGDSPCSRVAPSAGEGLRNPTSGSTIWQNLSVRAK
jgi:hypothetical protein